jgi:malate synthase
MNSAATERDISTGVRCFNTAPPNFRPECDLSKGFIEFLLPLHRELTPLQQTLIAKRAQVLASAHQGRKPDYLPPSEVKSGAWKIQLPSWCTDQRNQMTGPADDGELVVKMLNSGAPGVMLDLEDSMANFWPNLRLGIANILSALKGDLAYFDARKNKSVGIDRSKTVVFTRPRGLHLSQAGILPGELMSASLFDVAMVAYQADLDALQHPLSFYIPKSESAEEALWWRDLFRAIEDARSWPRGFIKCMALVESHPIAYQMEEFIHHLRDHIVGLNLGRWDYMASLIHFNLEDSDWVLPDRNTIPHDVPFFQNLRELLADTCHKRGILAIGGMTALYPSRSDSELNERALRVLAVDKKNEATCLMDGAWTGHPDQNEIAVKQFPSPNQVDRRKTGAPTQPDLRPVPKGVGEITLAGTRAAVRTVIRYRKGVLDGKGASLLDGYMEDLATDRIYRLMIAQRIRHRDSIEATSAQGTTVRHTPEFVRELFDEELERILTDLPSGTNEADAAEYCEARRVSELLVTNGEFDPI